MINYLIRERVLSRNWYFPSLPHGKKTTSRPRIRSVTAIQVIAIQFSSNDNTVLAVPECPHLGDMPGESRCLHFAKEFFVSSVDPAPPTGPTPQDLKSALKAFRKRLKLTQLDDQSRLGYGPMTGGQESSIVAITPPDQFPATVWEELARQGKLKRAGSGTYSLGQP